MEILILSLQRLYVEGKVSKTKIDTLKEINRISQENYDFIVGAKSEEA